MTASTLISICVPAYNRAKYLPALLDSILSQSFKNFEIVICEDASPERFEISKVVLEYQKIYPGVISFYQNEKNLGYDGNIRKLIEKSKGAYCFFLGNDDLLNFGALEETARIVNTYDNVGMVLKSYSWFNDNPQNVDQTVRYFSEEREFKAGKHAIHACFRRSGVIAGYIINRSAAHAASTNKFDGSLFYQMHLTARTLTNMNAVFTPKVLVLCRNGPPPEFGNSENEKTDHVPGSFTAASRLRMLSGAMSILDDLEYSQSIKVKNDVMRDYANYFYPSIRDQLSLPLGEYFTLYRTFAGLGFAKFPMFHVQCIGAYIIGRQKCDWIVKKIQRFLGRSPSLGGI